MRVPDNYDQFVMHQGEADRYMESRHICGWCGNPIQDDHAYNIEGDKVCPKCMEQWLDDRREYLED